MEYQNTIRNSITLSGRGLHTGSVCHVTLTPAAENTGIVFRRTDVNPPVDIPALATLVGSTSRNTTLCQGSLQISTVEHLLSALHGLRVDNVLICIDGAEVPILDGSAKMWVDAIQQVGLQMQQAERRYFSIKEPIYMVGDNDNVEYIAMPDNDFRVTTIIDFPDTIIGKQVAELNSFDEYATEVAQCRTFVFLHEIAPLLAGGLIKGGDLDNALVFVGKPLEPMQTEILSRIFQRNPEEITVTGGVLNTCQPYFSNEPARHKMLDFIGDIALIGAPVKGHFIIKCPGHKSNANFARMLINAMKESLQMDAVPTYNPNSNPVIGHDAIRSFLPHRFPFLMVDKVIEKGEDYIVGVKNVTTDEPFFQGHFPDAPIMPGVLQLEAMAQVGGLMVITEIENPELYSTALARIDGVKFRHNVMPGDTLIIKVHKLAPLRRGYLKMKSIAYVGNTIVTEATFVAQIFKKQQ